MNDIYDHKIQLEAAKLGTPAAKAAADMASSKFALENAELLQKNTARATALQGIRGSNSALDPITLGNAGLMTPEEAKKEQESISKQKNGIANLQSLYSQANKEANPKELLNPASATRLSTVNAGIADAILSTDINHRVSPETRDQFLKPYLITTRDYLQGTVSTKLSAALDKVKEFTAGTAPITEKYAPAALPQYPNRQAASTGPQYKVGDIVYVKGQKGQVLPSGQIKAVK